MRIVTAQNRVMSDAGERREMGEAGADDCDGWFDGRPDEDGAHEPGNIESVHEDAQVVDSDDAGDADTAIPCWSASSAVGISDGNKELLQPALTRSPQP
jgi:hypothetical protein